MMSKWLKFMSLATFLLAAMTTVVSGQEQSDEPNDTAKHSYLERLMAFDVDEDGKIGKDELPERLHKNFGKWDKNRDGFFDQQEMTELSIAARHESTASKARGNRREREGHRRSGGGPFTETDRDYRGPGFPGGPNGFRGDGHPPRLPPIEELVERALSFDVDESGELSEEELRAAFQDFIAQMPRPPRNRSGAGQSFGSQRPPQGRRSGPGFRGGGEGSPRGGRRSSRPPQMQRPQFDLE